MNDPGARSMPASGLAAAFCPTHKPFHHSNSFSLCILARLFSLLLPLLHSNSPLNMFSFKSSSKDNSSAQSKASSDADQEPVTHDPILTPPSDYKPQPSPFLNESQVVFLLKIGEYVRSNMLPEDHEYYASEKGFLTDATIIRYLRARKWDPEAAKIMLENTIKWRREYRPDQIDPEYIKSEVG